MRGWTTPGVKPEIEKFLFSLWCLSASLPIVGQNQFSMLGLDFPSHCWDTIPDCWRSEVTCLPTVGVRKIASWAARSSKYRVRLPFLVLLTNNMGCWSSKETCLPTVGVRKTASWPARSSQYHVRLPFLFPTPTLGREVPSELQQYILLDSNTRKGSLTWVLDFPSQCRSPTIHLLESNTFDHQCWPTK